MAQIPMKEGSIPFNIPSIDVPCITYYKIIGDLSKGALPVVILHGGPGAGHEYLLPFSKLWEDYGLPVIFYDQIGCASSTHLPQTAGDKSFWQEELFVSELNNLLDKLGLRDTGFHLLGQSWGGSLGAAFASSRPRGLRRLVLASGLASKELAIKGLFEIRAMMPQEVQDGLNEAEKVADYECPAYKDAVKMFTRRHLCLVEPFPPPELLPTMKNLSSDKTVYGTMYGPSSLTNIGSMLKWTVISRLPNITAPTLVYNGEHDSSRDVGTSPFFELIPRVRWITFAGAGHMCHLEGDGRREKVLKTVGDFLTQVDKSANNYKVCI